MKLRRSCGGIFPLRVAAVSLLVISLGACGFLEDSGSYLPKKRAAASEVLAHEWESGRSVLSLKGGGKFKAKNLASDYFSCAASGENGGNWQELNGEGTWSALTYDGGTDVDLEFESGCSATFWVGELDGKTVLWSGDTDKRTVLRY
ncbi:hypothetical protein J7E91_27670 [Streptomyces sp. ISL-99]|uniref:hypothetical protein n=1 Tax=Streptomyces sp. ISL-99 TaxID=2819193 RepID=UPI001BE8E14C|nr:hypothetical protein [Streptomyces sp. ISL-99]MBT2529083.1 hypothetical protein [Streptomyces sp. ISL-99]